METYCFNCVDIHISNFASNIFFGVFSSFVPGIKFSAHRARRFYARFLYKEGLDLEEIRLLMRHEKIDTTKDYIQMMQEDAIDVLRKRKIDFFEDETGSNPGRHSRLGRDLNPCHGLDRPV